MFPYDIKPVEKDLQKQLMNDFRRERDGYVQVGPKKWFFPSSYAAHAEKLYSYPIREDDVWVVTYPRTGTTVMQELVWLTVHDMDFEGLNRNSLDERFPFFEYTILHEEKFHQELRELNGYEAESVRKLAYWKKPVYEMNLPSPRLLKTHLPYSLLSPDLTKKCKSIYICRNPKDVAVSYYHHNRLLKFFDFKADFEKYWEYFEKDLLSWSPYWEHLKEGWAQRNNPNVLFLFYEDLIKDMPGTIRKVANFLGKELNENNVEKLSSFLAIDNFRNSLKLHTVKGLKNSGEQGFIRKGKVGANKEFSEQLNKRADEWIKKNCNLEDFEFPQTNPQL